jgi:hypothetical protein
MFLHLNKNLMFSDPGKVSQLPNNAWEEYIPMHPTIPELDPDNEIGNDEAETSKEAENADMKKDEAAVDVPTLRASGFWAVAWIRAQSV